MSFVLVAFFDVQGQVRGLNGEAKGGGLMNLWSLFLLYVSCGNLWSRNRLWSKAMLSL